MAGDEAALAVDWSFGSRSGSWFALVLFGALFGALCWVIARASIRRGARRSAMAAVAAIAWFGLVVLIYASSLGGFYDASVNGKKLSLCYLPAMFVEIVPLESIVEVEAAPAFRGRWRLHVELSDGERFTSATADRAVVERARDELHQQLAGTRMLK